MQSIGVIFEFANSSSYNLKINFKRTKIAREENSTSKRDLFAAIAIGAEEAEFAAALLGIRGA